MKKRIKILCIFSIIAILTYCTMQVYWLYSRYAYEIGVHEDELSATVQNVLDEYRELRQDTRDTTLHLLTSMRRTVEDSLPMPIWFCEIYVVDAKTFHDRDSFILADIARLYTDYQPDGISRYEYKFSTAPSDRIAYDGIRKTMLNLESPFKTNEFVTMLHEAGIKDCKVRIHDTEQPQWVMSEVMDKSIISPYIEITYPLDPLRCEVAVMYIPVPMPPVLHKMSEIILMSVIVSVLLLGCLVAQILMIRHQYLVEDMRQRFTSAMAHELKRPLYTLKMCMSYLENPRLKDDKKSMDALISKSKEEIDGLSSYFSKLRDVSSSERRQMPLNLVEFNAFDFLSEVIGKFSKTATKDVSVNIDCDSSVMLYADKAYMSDIVKNLMENSIKYSDEQVEIDMSCMELQRHIRLVIADNGWGISKKDRKAVFNEYYRGTNVSDQPGLGLGLAYVRQIVIAHGGKIVINDNDKEGTTFIIDLPVKG